MKDFMLSIYIFFVRQRQCQIALQNYAPHDLSHVMQITQLQGEYFCGHFSKCSIKSSKA